MAIQNNTSPLQLCIGDNSSDIVYDQAGENLDPDDQRAFYLHTTQNLGGAGDQVLAGPQGNSTTFGFIQGVTNYETVYYVTAIVGNQQGAGVDFNDPCALTSTVPVIFKEAPDVFMSAPSEICLEDGLEVDLSFTGVGPYTVTGTADIDGTYNSASTVTINPTATGTITLNIDRIANDVCGQDKNISVSTVVQESPTMGPENLICNATNTAYRVEFAINGEPNGDFVVDGYSESLAAPITGTISGTPPAFLSDEIPNGEDYQFVLSDNNINCSPTILNGSHNCPCETEVGTVLGLNEASPLCGITVISVNYDATNQVYDGDDTTNYILSTTPDLTGIFYQNASGIFDATADLNLGNLSYNTSYYLLAVVGNKIADAVDLDDGCTRVSNAEEIKFFPSPSVVVSSPDNIICLNTNLTLGMAFDGLDGTTYEVFISDNQANNYQRSAKNHPMDTAWVFPPLAGSYTYSIDSIIDNTSGCIAKIQGQDVSGSPQITVNPAPSTQLGGSLDFCFDGNGNSADIAFSGFQGDGPFNVYYSGSDGSTGSFLSSGADSSITVSIGNDPYTYTTTSFQLDSIKDTSPQQCIGLGDGTTVDFGVNPIPDLDLALDVSAICETESALPLGSNTVGRNGIIVVLDGVSYGDTQSADEGNNLTFAPISELPGSYTYTTISIKDQSHLQCENTDSVYVVNLVVNPAPTVRPYFTAPEICHGDSIELFFEVTGAGTVAFDYGNGLGISGSMSVPAGVHSEWITVSNTGSAYEDQVFSVFNIREVDGTLCGGTAVSNANLQVNPIPTGTIAISDPEICFGDAITLSFVGSGNGTLIFDYSYGSTTGSLSGVSGTSVDLALQPDSSTTFSIVQISDGSNPTCINSDPNSSVDLLVRELPEGTLTGGGEICFGEEFTFTANLIGAQPFSIEIEEDGTGTTVVTFQDLYNGANPLTQLPTSSIDYTLGQITDAHGCINRGSGVVPVIVNPTPEPLFSSDIRNACPPFEATFSNLTNPIYTGSGASYLWDFGNGLLSTNFSPDSVIYDNVNGGNYTVSLQITSPEGCVGRADSIGYIEVYPIPIPDYRANPGDPTVLNPNVYFDNYSEGATHYNWNFTDLVDSTLIGYSEVSPWHNFPDSEKSHEVCLEAISEFGCRDTICKIITVKDVLTVNIPNTFTPNDDGDNDIFKAIVNGYDEDLNGFSMTIFNRWGEQIFESQHPDNGWDGTYKGKPVKVGTFLYRVVVKSRNTTDRKEILGNVNLLR